MKRIVPPTVPSDESSVSSTSPKSTSTREVHAHLLASLDALCRCALEHTAEHLDMRRILHHALQRVAHALLAHDVDIRRLDYHAHLGAHLEAVVVLYHYLISVGRIDEHLVVHAFERTRTDGSRKHRRRCLRNDVNVLGTNYHVDRHIFAEARIDALELLAHEAHQTVAHHNGI